MARNRTRREEIIDLLSQRAYDFDELRRLLELQVHVLDEDLRHVARSVRGAGGRLHVERPQCSDCGFRFRRESFKPPGRCPKCRGHRITGPVMWIESPTASQPGAKVRR